MQWHCSLLASIQRSVDLSVKMSKNGEISPKDQNVILTSCFVHNDKDTQFSLIEKQRNKELFTFKMQESEHLRSS